MTSTSATAVNRAGALCAVLTLASCGIDQGGITAPGPTTGLPPPPELVVVSGPITAFGSIHVNDLVLDTARAQIRIEGAPATQADLAVGQMIRAVALKNGTVTEALTVDYEENVVGPIASIDVAAGSFTVLGQLVRTTATTRFGGTTQLTALSELRVGDRVSVSGIAIPPSEVHATYVARASASEPFELTGRVGALDAARLTFTLGGLNVDYSRPVLLEVPGGAPAANLIVEVTGSTVVNGALVAERVRALPTLPGTLTAAATTVNAADVPAAVQAAAAPQTLTSFLGLIATRFGPDTLVLDDVIVVMTDATTIVGATPAQLGPGTRVLIDGRIIEPNRIEALRIRIR